MGDIIYALDTFQASQEGQLTVVKNDQLYLLNDDHYYWWYVQEVNTNCMGFVPAELLELPNERLARQNSLRNQQVEAAEEAREETRPKRQRSVRFTPGINDVPDLSMDCSSEDNLPLAVEDQVRELLPQQQELLCQQQDNRLVYQSVVPGMAENIDKMDQLEKRLQALITQL